MIISMSLFAGVYAVYAAKWGNGLDKGLAMILATFTIVTILLGG